MKTPMRLNIRNYNQIITKPNALEYIWLLLCILVINAKYSPVFDSGQSSDYSDNQNQLQAVKPQNTVPRGLLC
jgi:hypothetical protein